MSLPTSLRSGHIAHRGLHGAGRPENSLAAMQAACDRGIAIELDVQPSADGVAMAFHDYTLDRLTGATGPVADQSAEDLGKIELSGGGEGIPRLADVLTLVAGRVPLLIELKDQDGDMGARVGPLEDAVVATLASYAGDCALMSFNPNSVAALRDRAPDRPRGLVTSAFRAAQWPTLSDATRDRLVDIPDFDRVAASFVSHQADALDMPQIAALKARGVPILCWTVRSPAEEAAARRVADAVTFEGYLP